MKYAGWIIAAVFASIIYGQHTVIKQRDGWVSVCDKALGNGWRKADAAEMEKASLR